MKKDRVTISKALTKRAGFARLGALFVVSSLSSAAFAGGSTVPVGQEPEDASLASGREAVKQCGTVSYDPQGGSLVINNFEVQVANPTLEASLVREARRAPFSACLIGTWLNLPRGKVFKADALDE